MELIIAILMYINVMFVDAPYTTQQIDQLYLDNQQTVDVIMSDEELTNQIYTDWQSDFDYDYDGTTHMVEKDEEPVDMEPIPF